MYVKRINLNYAPLSVDQENGEVLTMMNLQNLLKKGNPKFLYQKYLGNFAVFLKILESHN